MEVGIDFGTTFSTIAFSASGSTGCVPLVGSIFVETQVFIDANSSNYYIGKVAGLRLRQGISGRLYINPKRWVGVNSINYAEYVEKLKPTYSTRVNNSGSVDLGGIGSGPDILLPVSDIICLFLKGLIKECEDYTGTAVNAAVVSVPADYNSFKRSFVTIALKGLGIPVRAIVNEPTAAALYSLANTSAEDVLTALFDFGGGTFDISFLKKKGDILAVVYSMGDNFLGGRDIDRAILEYIRPRIREEFDERKLLFFLSTVKEDITNNPTIVDHVIPTIRGSTIVRLTADELDKIVTPFAERALTLFERGMVKFHPDPAVVVLTGGSSALRKVQELLHNSIHCSNIVFDVKDFRCSVAVGAKVYSDILANTTNLRLVDTLTNTLSDEVNNFKPIVVFPKGCPIPCYFKTTYTVSGSPVVYGVYEGENNRSFLNELTFRANSTSSESGRRVDSAEYWLSVDGTLEVAVNGVKLTNLFLPPPPSDNISRYVYLNGKERIRDQAIPEYIKIINIIHKLNITLEDLKNNSDSFRSTGAQENFEKILLSELIS